MLVSVYPQDFKPMKMKKYIILTFITVTFFSCNYMDEVPYDWAQPVDVFSMEQNYERPINQAYSYLIGGFNRINGSFLGAATDDGMSTISNSSIHRLSRAFVNSSSPIESCWDASYKGIRQALFVQKSLSEIDLVLNKKTAQEVIDIKNTYQGEMYALRAWYEFDLLRHYGGYPIINQYYQLGDPELAAKGRNSVAECVQNIVNLCDSAVKYLNVTPIGAKAEPYAGTDADNPVSDERVDHRHACIVKPAKHSCANDLRSVDHLE